MLRRKCTPGGAVRRGNLQAKRLALRLTMISVFGLALHGCNAQKSSTGSSIEFTKIPPAAQGGRERVDTIAGRVRNARPGQQIVILPRVGRGGCNPGPIAL